MVAVVPRSLSRGRCDVVWWWLPVVAQCIDSIIGAVPCILSMDVLETSIRRRTRCRRQIRCDLDDVHSAVNLVPNLDVEFHRDRIH